MLYPELMNFVASVTANPGISQAELDQAMHEITHQLPLEYQDLLRAMNGGEGFIGDSLFRLFSLQQVVQIHKKFAAKEYAADMLIIGSDGGGEAFALDYRQEDVTLIQIPFIPMDMKFVRTFNVSLTEFLVARINVAKRQSRVGNSSAGGESKSLQAGNPHTIGKEIHDILPIIFGGNPTDMKNKALVNFEDYLQVVFFWNEKYTKMRTSSQTIPNGD